MKAAISDCSDCGSPPGELLLSEVAAGVGDCVATADANEVASGGGIPTLVSAAITDDPIDAAMDEDSAALMEDDMRVGVTAEGSFDDVGIVVVPVVRESCMTDALGLFSGYELN